MTKIITPDLRYCDICGVQGECRQADGPFPDSSFPMRIHVDSSNKDCPRYKYSDVCVGCMVAISWAIRIRKVSRFGTLDLDKKDSPYPPPPWTFGRFSPIQKSPCYYCDAIPCECKRGGENADTHFEATGERFVVLGSKRDIIDELGDEK